jgi:hypothetical protein
MTRASQPTRVGWPATRNIRQPAGRTRPRSIRGCCPGCRHARHSNSPANDPPSNQITSNSNLQENLLSNLQVRFYTAAVYLQRIYFEELKSIQGNHFYWLPDFYSTELNIQQESDPIMLLTNLGQRHQDLTGIYENWVGTYKNVIAHLLNRRKLEMEWSQ